MARKKAKKRGVKPGTKRGPYKKRGRKKIVAKLSPEGWKVGDTVRIRLPKDFKITETTDMLKQTNNRLEKLATLGPAYTPSPVLTLCGQLEDSILLLEQRISNAIAKINSLM